MGSLCECRRLSVLDWRGVFAQKRRADLEEDGALVLVFSNRKMSLKEAKGRRSGFFLSFSD
jgi:hypothetical protein